MNNKEPQGKQQKEEDIDLDEVEMGMVIVRGNDVIAQHRLLALDVCPRIPLCKLIPHAQVQGLCQHVGGSCITWIEPYVHIQGLVITRLVFGLDRVAYGLVNEEGEYILDHMFSSLFVVGYTSYEIYDASKESFENLHSCKLAVGTHFLPDAKKSVLSSMASIQGPMERSFASMEAVLALLCPKNARVGNWM
ncbi:hypothetical protein L7F22_063864 [Adiantum nelumboides]|nr:hypothetical protein [Adiantum nelumboides]